ERASHFPRRPWAWSSEQRERRKWMAETSKAHASGRIEVDSYEPKPYAAPSDGPQLVEINVRENLVGDTGGDGVAGFLQAQRQDGSASFVGLERVTGKVAGK